MTNRTVVGLFQNVEDAQRAVEGLLSEGFNSQDVGVVRSSQQSETSAGTGVGAGDVVGTLTTAGIPRDDSELYAEGVREGATLVMLRTSESYYARAMEVLNRFSPLDMRARATRAPASGGISPTANPNPYTNVYAREFEDFEAGFRQDCQARYGDGGDGYERYQPAYRYGWDSRRLFGGRDWATMEPELQAGWEQMQPADEWEHFRDAVRSGWERVTSEGG